MPTTRSNRAPILVALGLAWVAGSIDAIGYVSLQQIFTANMTGNTVLLGMALAEGDGLGALRHGVAIAIYLGGALLGSALAEGFGRRLGFRTPFVVEAGLLLLFWAYAIRSGEHPGEVARAWHRGHYGLLALLCLSTGIQTMAMPVLRDGTQLRTTFLTGVIATFAQELMRSLHHGPLRSPKAPSPPLATALASTFAGYLLGGICGLVALRHLEWNAILLPAAALALVGAFGRCAFPSKTETA